MPEPTDPVVIVGATGGIAKALAARLSAAGRPLHLIARDAAALGDLPLSATTAVADVMDAAALTAAIRAAGPRIAGLAYCVGSIVMTPLRRRRTRPSSRRSA